jgi:thiol:disulfide interchange protein DsbD
MVLLAGLAAPGRAAPEAKGNPADLLRFEVSVTAGDPFDPANEKKGNATLVKVRRGQTVQVTITGTPQPGYHTYPVTVRTAVQDELSRLKVGDVKGVKPVWPVQESPPEEAREDKGRIILEHSKPFTWTLGVLVLDDARPGPVELPIKVITQVCDEHQCVPVARELRASFEVSDESPVPTDPEVQKRAAQPMPEPIVVASASAPPPAPVEKKQGGPPAPAAEKSAHEPFVGLISVSHEEFKARMEKLAEQVIKPNQLDTSLWAFILAGVFWGGISLITPCVFPMIPITVSFFLKQSEKEHHRPVVMATVYSLTIVVVLTLAAAFLLSLFRWLSINPLMNYGLGALFVFFALSLFGMYEIELPSGLARFTSSREGQGGLVGTMFMALTFTIISFACVAPFLGGFGGTAAAARPLWQNLLGGLAFSATFAAPFFVLALFPTLLKTLPKSGSWLNSVKVVMGYLELAAAFKFFRGAELIQTSGNVSIFSYDLVLSLWIGLALLSGLYLLGFFRLPHDTPEEHIGVPRMLFSAAFIGLGLYLMPALFKVNGDGGTQRPGGAIFAWVDSFLLPESRGSGEAGKQQPKTGDLLYAVEKAREITRKTGQPQRIFLDFTGLVCTNCRINEQYVFSRPEVKQALQQYLYVELYTDGIPAELFAPELQAVLAKDKERSEADAQVNADFEQKVFDEITLPLYAILEPQADGRIVIVDVYNEGRIQDVPEFMRFLTGARAKEKAAP